MGWGSANGILEDTIRAFLRLEKVETVVHEIKVAITHSLIESLEAEDADCLDEVYDTFADLPWVVEAFARAGYDMEFLAHRWDEAYCD